MARTALAFGFFGLVSAAWPPAPGPPPPPPPLNGNILYHLFEPKYTGLANKDAGDFKGDLSFIFLTFNSFNAGNPEASMESNIIEMSEVNVTGWNTSGYEACNAPGCNTKVDHCPANQTVYCCKSMSKHLGPSPPAVHDKNTLPGAMPAFHQPFDKSKGGWWLSFPMESEGSTWTEKLRRRINGKCLGDAWRKDAGGCQSCGQALDQCVATCIKRNVTADNLQKTWDRVFADPKECPDVPLPVVSAIIV